MRRQVRTLAVVSIAAALAGASVAVSGQARPKPSPATGEWPHYTADLRGTRYSPLDQINAANFNDLEVAWRFKTNSLGTAPEFKLEGTPLMVGGVLYTTGGTRRAAIALDGRTGELLWVHRYPEGRRGAMAPRQLSGRGLAYWTDGRGDERILYVTPGYRLIALDARTGAPLPRFGRDGVVDLKVGVVSGSGQQIDLETGEIGINSTPTIVQDVVLIGSSMKEGHTVTTHNNTKGLVRAFDVRTGKLLWTFNTIPRPGEFGNDTWLDGSWATNGNTGVWSQITVDEELGLVYLPVESPTSDFYGGKRPGNNLFGESLVCVDLKTGKRKWHFQFVHHPIWNWDIPSAPILADIVVAGRPIKAVAVPTKQAWLYVFDRVTGEPVWPIEEKPVPRGDVPGEWYSPTQPHPPAALMYGRNALTIDELIDFTPAMRAQAIKNLERYRWTPGVVFSPALVGDVNGLLGSIVLGNGIGGTNWTGGGYDPETHVVYAHAVTATIRGFSVAPPPPGFSDIPYQAGVVGREFRVAEAAGTGTYADAPRRRPTAPTPAPASAPAPAPTPSGEGGGGGDGLTIEGLPILKPPYGVLAAIHLDRGSVMWRVPHGDTPDLVRNHPTLRHEMEHHGLQIPKTGQSGNVGVLVTKTLVVIGDPQATTMPDRPRGAMLRAYDKATGEEVGAVWMPAAQSGSPMTYSVAGKQYIVVAVGGGAYSGEYLAFSLPTEPEVPTQAARP